MDLYKVKIFTCNHTGDWNVKHLYAQAKAQGRCDLWNDLMSIIEKNNVYTRRERETEDKFEIWESGGEEIFFVLRKKEKGIFFIALHVVEKL